MSRSASRLTATVVAVAMLTAGAAAGCGRAGDRTGGVAAPDATAPTPTVPAPEALPDGADLYQPPASLLAGPAGTLAWYDELAPVGRARAWRTLTRSTSADGDPTWVTSVVYQPGSDAPEGGFPVLVWAHGTAGVADSCAPSRAGAQVPSLGALLSAGFAVVAPDSAGLGPPGPAQYLVGGSEGHALLDAARSAAALPGADLGVETGLWGFSSGGQAVLFAAQDASDYAPGLELLGTVAQAPVSDVARFAGHASAFPLTFGFAFLTFGAWADIYEGADLATILTPTALAELSLLDEECALAIGPHFTLTPIDRLRVADPETTPPWPALMAENSVGARPVTAPLLLVQGTDDPIIAPESTSALAQRQCEAGAVVELRSLPGQHDLGLVDGAAVARWFDDRLAGVPARSTCSP